MTANNSLPRSSSPAGLGAKLALVLTVTSLTGACASQAVVEPRAGAASLAAPLVTVDQLISGLAPAGEIALDAPPISIAAMPRQDEIVCRDLEVTGTRFRKNVCKPAGEWDDLRRRQTAEGRQFVRETIRNSGLIDREKSNSFGSGIVQIY